jgi:hypothetical protein
MVEVRNVRRARLIGPYSHDVIGAGKANRLKQVMRFPRDQLGFCRIALLRLVGEKVAEIDHPQTG